MPRFAVFFAVLCAASPLYAMEVTDATGRHVVVPDRIEHVLPAGPPAAVILAAIAPGQIIGFPGPVSETAKAALAPAAAAKPNVARLTSQPEGIAAIQALHPDLIIDYGTVSPRYIKIAEETQEKTGIPTLLFDGALEQIPSVSRTLGQILHQPEQAETVARVAEAILSIPLPDGPHPRVLYARGAQGNLVAAAGSDVTAVFARLGWPVLAPEGQGTFRPANPAAIAALDPDILIFSDPAMKARLGQPDWGGIRAVREGHAYVSPSVPFGWIEEPPSINSLLGVAWLRGGDPVTLAVLFNALVYNNVLTSNQIAAIAGDTPVIKP